MEFDDTYITSFKLPLFSKQNRCAQLKYHHTCTKGSTNDFALTMDNHTYIIDTQYHNTTSQTMLYQFQHNKKHYIQNIQIDQDQIKCSRFHKEVQTMHLRISQDFLYFLCLRFHTVGLGSLQDSTCNIGLVTYGRFNINNSTLLALH